MREIHIGEIIKQKRTELGLTQEELCEGICEPATLSRIESGIRTPSRSKLNALLQRLGLPGNKYYAMMSENELEIERLKDEIIDCNTRKLWNKGLMKINQLSFGVDKEDLLTQQFILRSRVLIGKQVNDSIVPYTFHEKIDLLFQAIHLTIPNFESEKIGSHWYSLDEMKIINQIAREYGDNKQQYIAIKIYSKMMEFIRHKLSINADNVSLTILVSYNFCLFLSQVSEYDKALEIALWGWDKCIEWSRSGWLGGLLFVVGKCLYFTGKVDESKDYFIQSYYAFKSMRNDSDMNLVATDIQNYFGIEL